MDKLLVRHFISLSIGLAAFWLLNSGHYNPLLLSLGAISILIVLYIVHRMDVIDHESQPIYYLPPEIIVYYLWLIKEIVLANIQVVKHIWLGNDSISPTMKTIRASQKSDMGKVIYANSITLTPGTVTVDMDHDMLTVHALVSENLTALEEGEMDRRVSRLED